MIASSDIAKHMQMVRAHLIWYIRNWPCINNSPSLVLGHYCRQWGFYRGTVTCWLQIIHPNSSVSFGFQQFLETSLDLTLCDNIAWCLKGLDLCLVEFCMCWNKWLLLSLSECSISLGSHFEEVDEGNIDPLGILLGRSSWHYAHPRSGEDWALLIRVTSVWLVISCHGFDLYRVTVVRLKSVLNVIELTYLLLIAPDVTIYFPIYPSFYHAAMTRWGWVQTTRLLQYAPLMFELPCRHRSTCLQACSFEQFWPVPCSPISMSRKASDPRSIEGMSIFCSKV